MKKSEIFETIKIANALVDQMAGLSVNSPEYGELNQTLGWTLDTLIGGKNYCLQMSKRTGHYWVKFF